MTRLAKPKLLNRHEIATNIRMGNGYRTSCSNLSLEGWYNAALLPSTLPKRTDKGFPLFEQLEAPAFLRFSY